MGKTVEKYLYFKDLGEEGSKRIHEEAKEMLMKPQLEIREYFNYIDSIGKDYFKR